MKYLLFIIMLFFQITNAQKISMYFPAFAGKTYDFILFHGSKTNVLKGTIPSDGKFSIEIPKEFSPYHGMSRWLITNTEEGGGLDMIIPGSDFSVECLAKKPSENDIVYKGNIENKKLDSLFRYQNNIIDKYSLMSKAINIYKKTENNYNLYYNEYNKQLNNYNNFLENISRSNTYINQFLMINNITTGVGRSRLNADETTKVKDVSRYIIEHMDWQILYTSGYWDTVIKDWIDIQINFLNEEIFMENFSITSTKLENPEIYTSYVERITHYLTILGKDDLIQKLTKVLSFQKLINYDGALSLYKNALIGNHAPNLIISEQRSSALVLKSADFAKGGYENTLLLFYQSDCEHCESVLNEILEKYSILERKKLRLLQYQLTQMNKFSKNHLQNLCGRILIVIFKV
ncbi:hypothetical protein [Chryseobacterium wanjuense]